MACCPTCGLPKMEKAELGPLLVTLEPNGIYWRGIRKPSRSAQQHKLLYLLTKRREVSPTGLRLYIDASRETVGTHLCKLRKWFAEVGIPAHIRFNGENYEIKLDKDLMESF